MASGNALDEKKKGRSEAKVEDLILRRWSPRAFSNKKVSEDDLRSVFSAAQWAASSFNEQPWRFLVGQSGDQSYKKIFDALMDMNQSWAKNAPVLYAAFAKKTFSHNGTPNRVAMHDVGAACANLSLQATALGLHTHGMAGFDGKKLQETFAVPDDFEPIACWALGYLGDPSELPEKYKNMEEDSRTRKELGHILFSEWDSAALLE